MSKRRLQRFVWGTGVGQRRQRVLAGIVAVGGLLAVVVFAVTTTLYPTTNTTSGVVTNPTNAYANDNTGALVSSNSSSLTVAGFDNTNVGTISDVTVWVKYKTTAAPGNDSYQFAAATDGATFNQTIVAQSTADQPGYATASLSLGPLTWTQVGALAVQCLTSRQGGADGYSVDWDVAYIVITYTTGNVPPTVTISAPANDSNIGGPAASYTINGTANDTDGTVQSVRLQIVRGADYWDHGTSGWTTTPTWVPDTALTNGGGWATWSYSWAWPNDMDGAAVSVTAEATDDQAATGTDTNATTVDTKAPVSTVAVRLSPDNTPLSGEQLVLKSEWNEASPGANVPEFNWTLNGTAAGWSNADSYTTGTATRNTGVTLNGDDQITLIQSRFTDSFSNGPTLSQNASTVWVKPLTPPAPTVAYVSGQTDRLAVTVNANGAPTGLLYAIQCDTAGGYVQGGACGGAETWQTLAAWGSPITVTGLSPGTTYAFSVAAGNPNDSSPSTGENSASPYGATGSDKTGQAVTTGTPTATPSGCQVTVSAPFTGDGNANSTTTILGKQASNCAGGGYASIGCDNLSGASPRTCVHSGLTATTDYCYQVTFTDVDGVSGSNPQTVGATTGTCGNTAPTVTITAPANGSSFTQGTLVTFTGTASDVEDGDLTASLSWTSSLGGAIGSGGSFGTSTLSVGSHTITASVTDSGSLSGQDQITVNITSAVNTAPAVSVSAPTTGTTFAQGATVSFAGTATDSEDGILTSSLSWSSSRDGAIGTGGSFTKSNLTVGTHTITASVTDSGGASGQDQVTVTVSANATTVGTPTATASSCGQITVSAFFTGDADVDGSILVEWSVAGANSWTTSCATVTGASPRRCLVAGLTESQSYDIRVTFTDPDNGAIPAQTVSNVGPLPACNGTDDAPPTVLVLAPSRNAVVSGLDTVKVQVYDSGAGDHSGLTITRSVDGGATAAPTVNTNYDCGTDCKVYEFDLDTTTGLANGSHYLSVSVTDASSNVARVDWPFRVNNQGTSPAGGGYLLRRTHGSQLCIDCHNLPTHSSQATDTGYGNWAMSCLDCHTPHKTKNIYLIREQIDTPSSGRRTVRFERNTVGATGNSSTPGQASFVNEDNASQADGPCQVCHTRTGGGTARWRNVAAGGNAASHYTSASGKKCTDCHQHDKGFKGAGGDCLGCHGGVGGAGTTGPNSRRPVQDDFGKNSHHVGALNLFAGQTNMGGALTAFDCVVCHAEGYVEWNVADAKWEAKTNPLYHGGDDATKSSIDLRDVDNRAMNATAAGNVFSYNKEATGMPAKGSPATWNSSNQAWREQTSGYSWNGSTLVEIVGTGLDRFCLTCHDANGASTANTGYTGGGAHSALDSPETFAAGPYNPFGDKAITNEYDTMVRKGYNTDATPAVVDRLTDIKSKVSGSPPPQGQYSRHAIRGQSTSRYSNYLSTVAWPSNPNGYRTIFDGTESSPTGTRFRNLGSDEKGNPVWNDTSVMGCADCHTTDGANGTNGSAHGSNSEYLLKDANGLATEGTFPGGTYNCFRCHYNANMSPPYMESHTGGSGNDYQDTVSATGAARITTASKGYGTRFGIACLNCHGGGAGDGTTAGDNEQTGFGWIHGTSQKFRTGENGDGGVTRLAYRFMNGGGLRFFLPGDNTNWNTGAGTCYTLTNVTSWSGCRQHNRGTSGGPFLKRTLNY